MSNKDILHVGLIGCGRAGSIHAGNFAQRVPQAALVAVCDPVEDAAKKLADDLHVNNVYTSHLDLINDKNVDAVVIVVPTDLHMQMAIDAANAGKHILCEKPMAMNIAECEKMIEAADNNNVKLQLGFMRRFDSSFVSAKAMVDAGEIGDIVYIRSNTRGPSKPRPWMYDITASNGVLAEINSHDIDSIRWFAGADFNYVHAVAGNYRNPEVAAEYPDYYDHLTMNGRMENGILFSIDGGAYVQYGYDSRMEIVGTHGVLHVGRTERDFIELTGIDGKTKTPFLQSWMDLFVDAYLSEDRAFVDAVLNNLAPPVTGYDGKMAVKTVEAGNRSIVEKRPVSLEEF